MLVKRIFSVLALSSLVLQVIPGAKLKAHIIGEGQVTGIFESEG